MNIKYSKLDIMVNDHENTHVGSLILFQYVLIYKSSGFARAFIIKILRIIKKIV
ncbi:Hypothetical protein CKL_0489 [Clostridium kluyveri DSM 555]|uniref:Uncharacterized protein n=1 Tax=Clostridium kluyveri (strain ATCC 8527 / DSM 555 / NBRC 12016 / NCIMB 10680 / K1) TaxID=431943 RepID=A5N5G2_CLOK5|nr:Hypothetical protein CKL_0489 [Clostridium kluyveri DSM 555]